MEFVSESSSEDDNCIDIFECKHKSATFFVKTEIKLCKKLNKIPECSKKFVSVTKLNLPGCKITKIDALPPNLMDLYLPHNEIKEVNQLLIPQTLKYFNLSNNDIRTLDISKTQITDVNMEQCGLKYFKGCDKLETLNVDYNFDIILDLELCQKLEGLWIGLCGLNEMPKLSDTLKNIYMANNNIERITWLPPNLEYLNCTNNGLTYICDLPKTLETFCASSNKLKEFKYLDGKLQYVFCCDNNMENLIINNKDIVEVICYNNPFKNFQIANNKCNIGRFITISENTIIHEFEVDI
jgi:Leucine-rich repeat (LRR) protein